MNRIYDKAEWPAAVDLSRESDFQLGHLNVRPSLCEIAWQGGRDTIEPRVMQVIVVLAQAKGAVVSRDELVRRCWGGRIVSEDAINRCMTKVRRVSELNGGAGFTLETVPRVGYRLIDNGGGLERVASAASPAPPDARHAPLDALLSRRNIVWIGVACALLVLAVGIGWFVRNASGSAVHLQEEAAVPPPPAGSVFRDCTDGCPDMVVVPAERFEMGSPVSDSDHRSDEIPQHAVTIARPFAISRYPITRAEYARFASETGKVDDDTSCFTLTQDGRFIETPKAGWRNPGFQQTSRDPVVCMDWDDAIAYADWLSRKTGKRYRLPSEAEWEYAARAGNAEARPGAASRICTVLNGGDADYHAKVPDDPKYNGACRDGYPYTSPVGSFPPNAFGLFDMMGNVGQWVADCYNTTYDGAPSDGSAWRSGNCAIRVLRGGTWTDDSRNIRFARRGVGLGAGRFSSVGIRLARSL